MATGWVTSAFSENITTKAPKFTEELWVDAFEPKFVSDLAVHKKKIEEVTDAVVSFYGDKHSSGLLVLNGPPGCGKTSCLKAIVNEIGIELCEWVTPVDNPNDWEHCAKFGLQSHTQQFSNFLLKGKQYPSLNIGSCKNYVAKKLLLIEDIPNALLRDIPEFHNIISQYSVQPQSLAVFIISDAQGNEVYRKLFPNEVIQKLRIKTISFNPVSRTGLVKALSNINSDLSSEQLNSVVEASKGDIRSALNSLQFTSTGVGNKKTSSTSRKRKYKKHNQDVSKLCNSSQSIGTKDESLCLFRALGKVFYVKRETSGDEIDRLPPAFQSMERQPLLRDPEEIYEKAPISTDGYFLFLHENYLDFFTEISDSVRACEYISLSESLLSEWTVRQSLEECASSVITRGLLHSNTVPVKGTFKPLRKPVFYSNSKTKIKRLHSASALLAGDGFSKDDAFMDILSYRHACRLYRNAQEKELCEELSDYERGLSRNSSGCLTAVNYYFDESLEYSVNEEKNVETVTDTAASLKYELSEEETHIEEYSD